MLVLTRQRQQAITIGNDIQIKILRIDNRSVRIGIEAPDNIQIFRHELLNQNQSIGFSSRKREEKRRPILTLNRTRVGQIKS